MVHIAKVNLIRPLHTAHIRDTVRKPFRHDTGYDSMHRRYSSPDFILSRVQQTLDQVLYVQKNYIATRILRYTLMQI